MPPIKQRMKVSEKNIRHLLKKLDKRHNDLRRLDTRRLDELATLESKRNDDLRIMHYSYEEKLSAAETKRLDGIRPIDDKAMTMANEKATLEASVFQSQVSTAAETQRELVTSTAQTIATQLQQIVTPMNERVSVLEKANFEGQGKSTINEPLMASIDRSEEHTSELQSRQYLVCRLLL